MTEYVKLYRVTDEAAMKMGGFKENGVWIVEKEKLAAYKQQRAAESANTAAPTPAPATDEVTLNTENDTFWDNYTASDNLQYVISLRTQGMPKTSENRAKFLTAISNRQPGFYPVTYEALCQYSTEFAVLYSQDRVLELIRRCITGAKPYIQEIQESNLNAEEKALLMLVLPI